MSIIVGTACSGIGGAEVALDLAGTNPEYARHWLWHPSLGDLQSPLAPRQKQTKDRLISLGNAWVPQTAVPIMARIAEAIVRTSVGSHST